MKIYHIYINVFNFYIYKIYKFNNNSCSPKKDNNKHNLLFKVIFLQDNLFKN